MIWTDLGVNRERLPALIRHHDAPVVFWLWRSWVRSRKLALRAALTGRWGIARALTCRARERRREMHSWLIQIGVR